MADERRSVMALEQEGVLQGFIVGHDLGTEWEIENMAVRFSGNDLLGFLFCWG